MAIGRTEMRNYRRIEAQPITGALGAEIVGADLSAPDDEMIRDIRQALLDHLVIFFRDQALTPQQHKAFGLRFGAMDRHPFMNPAEDDKDILQVLKEVDDRVNVGGVWHSDVTFQECPALGSILYAKEIPPHGGDTLFANMYLAYESLSDGMKAMLGPLKAVHSAAHVFGPNSQRYAGKRSTRLHDQEAALVETAHPVVRTHPETGRKLLFVNSGFTVRFKDMTAEESRPLLDFLFRHLARPEFTCRFRWTPGAVAFWDNRSTQHLAVNDYHGHRRLMHRVTVAGDRPY
jgi:taurine dioxygenase